VNSTFVGEGAAGRPSLLTGGEMTTWRLFYENRFPPNAVTGATLLDVQRAAAGTLSVQSGPVFTTFTGFRGFGIGDGRNMTYRPTAFLRQVIGLDVSMEVAFLRLVTTEPVTLCSTDATSIVVTATAPPAADGRTTCRLDVRVGTTTATVQGLTFRARFGIQPVERRQLQVRWTTNGQLHVFLDGQLVAYENNAAPGFSFNLVRWSVGDVVKPMLPVLHGAVSNVRVVELREDSAVDSFGEAIDPEVPEIGDRCVKVIQTTVQQHLREARALMARFTQSQTRHWRPSDGGSPFKPAAIVVHEAGGRAGVALGRYLREGTDDAREQVLVQLRKLLPALAADQPDAFKALVSKIRKAQDAAQYDCKASAQKIRDANPALFKKLDALHDAIDQIVANLGA
jgi:hypothetical protein